MSDNKNKQLNNEVFAEVDDVESLVKEEMESGLGNAEEITNWSEVKTSDIEAGDVEEPDSTHDEAGEEPEPSSKKTKKDKKDAPEKREKKKRDGSQKKEKPVEKEPNRVVEYVKGIRHEMKLVDWPTKPEVLKWSLIVMAVICFFALLTFVIDNLIATPLMYVISGAASDVTFGISSVALTVLFFASGLGTVAGVMLHSGGDSNGLSDTLSTQLTGGSAVAEKNLDRITIALALVFAVVLILMMVFFPQGSLVGM